MINSNVKELDLLNEFNKFISETKSGKRTKKDGEKILHSSVKRLHITYTSLLNFSEKQVFKLRIIPVYKNKLLYKRERNYWKKFYKYFTSYLYKDLNCFDNYVGSIVKDIRVFFNYLITEKNLQIPQFHKKFYIYKETIQILTLSPGQLNFLIHDKQFEQTLRPVLKKVKDILVAGCTVALRYSDLMNLKLSNLEKNNEEYYLKVQSQKTKIYTRIKLPLYVMRIFKKYSLQSKTLLPYFNLVRLNLYIKELSEYAGWTNEIIKTRQKRGKATIIYRDPEKKLHFRFCDLASSHIMRRTAITTMLRLQMPEHLVKRISGHSPNSTEFHKYVAISQNYLDIETDKMYNKLLFLHTVNEESNP